MIFRFNNLSKLPWLGHAVSDKSFGNLSYFVSDKKSNVDNNRKTFFDVASVVENDVVEMQQVHGNHVKIVSEEEKGQLILETDAIITRNPGVVLIVKAADCVPILLSDPVKKVIGVVHAGWKGTAQEIAKLAVNHMEDHFGTTPADLIVGIGPSIGPCCYEVDTPVIEQFKYKFNYADKLFSGNKGGRASLAEDSESRRANLDLWQANKFQLIETGVKEKNIEVSGICTYDNSKLYFSDRKNKSEGRFGSILWIK